MGATMGGGGLPTTIIDLVEREWRVMRASPAAVEAFERWGKDDPVIAQFPTIAALFAYVECRSRPARQREDVLAALACRASEDVVAATMLLQLLLPGCKALVASFGWLGDSAAERAADVIGDVWARIRAMPVSPRPLWVAMPVLSAARDQLRRRAREVSRVAPSGIDGSPTASQILASEREPSATEELAEVLKEANVSGILSREQAELIWAYRVRHVSPAEAAKQGGISAAAVERRRLRAELLLRRAYGAVACA
ncbi:MAG: hypothetical protein M3450_04970 [Actinomycetota bacterium]|nr:hypothetical protein [Actinomycetota bacterium]